MLNFVALFTNLLVIPQPHAMKHSIVISRYADTLRDEGGPAACFRRMPDDEFDMKYDRRCASRTLPCGTLVIVKSEAGITYCYVLDRGPWNKLENGKYRGDLDLSPIPATEAGITLAHSSPGRLAAVAWKAPTRLYKARKGERVKRGKVSSENRF